MRTLLVAINRDDTPAIRAALEGEFVLRICHSLQAVRDALDGAHAVVCGLHFDEGKLFALLEMLGTDDALRRVPVLCVKDAGNSLSPSIRKSITIATGKLGSRGFADLGELRAEHGEAHAHEKLRATLRALIDAAL